ncbi:hypothetical protein GCM10011357_23880 [Lacimicrobium alkaliphilum]|uniref:AB hydrolase-1 domain-containing protein n=2 Tax=Lacimicrobium alkaliphilum TaxID=1526571 RepID=A0ABQ1RHH9_9ALTE|nr:hypothetical protein GCM10011357_23880 [Lacimicrobium alkaliphilum]
MLRLLAFILFAYLLILRLFLFILFAYLLLLAAVYLLQQRLLYFPDQSRASERQLEDLALRVWPEQDFRGYLTGETAQQQGTVLVFHGNAGAAWHRSYYAEALKRQGYRVLLVEYPGYGGRPGKPDQHTLTEDGLETLNKVQQHFDGPVYLWGESLGAGVVASIVARLPEESAVAGVILMAPWDSLTNLAQHHYWYLPVHWLIKDRYNSIKNLSGFDKPVVILVAGKDKVIPNRHSLALYDALAAKKSLWRFDDATHNSWPYSPQQRWWKEVMTFVSDSATVHDNSAN